MKSILDILLILGATRVPTKEIANRFDVTKYNEEEWNWIEKQVVKFSPRGYSFVQNISRERDYMDELELKEIDEENKVFLSQLTSKNVKRE